MILNYFDMPFDTKIFTWNTFTDLDCNFQKTCFCLSFVYKTYFIFSSMTLKDNSHMMMKPITTLLDIKSM